MRFLRILALPSELDVEPDLRHLGAAIAVKRVGQTIARFGGVGLALKHDVPHAQLGVAAHRSAHLRHSADQWVVEEARFLLLEIRNQTPINAVIPSVAGSRPIDSHAARIFASGPAIVSGLPM